MDLRFRLHCVGRDLSNWALVKSRDYQGFLITGQNSGTQWVKFMLSLAIAKHYDVPPPKYFNNPSSNDIIGNPKHKPKYPDLPRIASSHSIPCYVLDIKPLRAFLKFPPYAVVVRDIRDVLVSHYAKHGSDYMERRGKCFAEYIRLEPHAQKGFRNNIWWYMHFKNRWAALQRKYPGEVKIWQYEDLRADPEKGLREICAHFNLDLSDEAIAFAVENTTKEAMEQYRDPDVRFRIVRSDKDQTAPVLKEEDRRYIAETLHQNLRDPLGYAY